MIEFKELVELVLLSKIDKDGFMKIKESHNAEFVSIEHLSKQYFVRLEQYRGEVYVTFCKKNSNKEVNLFNLLSYLMPSSQNVPKAVYFDFEKNLVERIKSQLDYISEVIHNNFQLIHQFFTSYDFDSKVAEIDKFMIKKYPSLFRRS